MPSPSTSTSTSEQLADNDGSLNQEGQLLSTGDSGSVAANDVISGKGAESPAIQQPKTESDEAAQSWLDAQCGMISGTKLGIVLSSAADGTERQLALWPATVSIVPAKLLEAAHSALRERSFVIISREQDGEADQHAESKSCFVASPLKPNDPASPVAAFELPNSIRHQQQAIVQLLQWGGVWFDLLRRKRRSGTQQSRLVTVVELLTAGLEHAEFDAAALAAVTELAAKLPCAQASLGLLQGQSVKVLAISNSTRIDTRLNLIRDIGAAMNEAIDQDATLEWPPKSGGLPHVTYAQKVLAKQRGSASVLSTPLYDGINAVGALTLERDGEEGFDQECRDVCETLAVLLGPVLALKYDRERPILHKLLVSLRNGLKLLSSTRQVAIKLYAGILIVAIAFLSTATGDYRITAQARLEGSMKRVIAAPRDGFVASAQHRAGDIVEAGELLASLDDRELRLEQVKLNSQREQLDKEHRAALTSHDRSTTAILNSRKMQTSAQLALIDEQLLRTQLTAPFDGIVVSGDLSQRIGSSVENGQVLFEITPLDDYRVVLEVDEREIGDVAETQRGVLTLTGLPDATHAFTVERIVPLSTPQEGRNIFEVQARLDSPGDSIRPGMEGVGKIEVDRRKLIWVWTHELIDWLRLTLWTWVS